MLSCLNAATLRQGIDFPVFVQAAADAGFAGVEIPMGLARRYVAERGDDAVRSLLRDRGLTPAAFGYGLNPNAGDEDFDRWARTDLAETCALATALGLVGGTVVLPFSRSRGPELSDTFLDRIRRVADVAGQSRLDLHLEFIGLHQPPSERGDYVQTLPGTLDLITRLGRPNVGVLLDSYHWYLSGGTTDDVDALRCGVPLFVHINDAPAGPPETLTDPMRVLPGDGVIDLIGFLRAVQKVGYDGFVSVEVFSDTLRSLDPTEAARGAHDALASILRRL